MDPEGAPCLLTLECAYGKPRLCIYVHCSSLRSTAHRAAAVLKPAAVDAALHTLRRQCTSEGSMSRFKSIT